MKTVNYKNTTLFMAALSLLGPIGFPLLLLAVKPVAYLFGNDFPGCLLWDTFSAESRMGVMAADPVVPENSCSFARQNEIEHTRISDYGGSAFPAFGGDGSNQKTVDDICRGRDGLQNGLVYLVWLFAGLGDIFCHPIDLLCSSTKMDPAEICKNHMFGIHRPCFFLIGRVDPARSSL